VSDPERAQRSKSAAERLACLLATVGLLQSCSLLATPPSTTEVLVRNEGSGNLWLFKANRDGWRAPQPLGARRQLRLQLTDGRYALGQAHNAPRFALPVLPLALGYVPKKLTVTVNDPPAADQGWCWIPAGPFVLGDRLGVGQEDERPVRVPTSSAFWLAAHETSNEQYVNFLNALGTAAVELSWLDLGGPKCGIAYDGAKERFFSTAPQMPVVTVSAAGAAAYCEWRTAVTSVRHRLPTEAEWEKAARGPGSRVYAYGDTFMTRGANQESGALARVGLYAPNEFGLFDMTGNAFEWTSDVYVSGREDDPFKGDFQALRGGSFLLDGVFVRNAMRMRLRPTVRADDVGFRVLREHP